MPSTTTLNLFSTTMHDACVHSYTHIRINIYRKVLIHVCVCACTFACILAYIHVCVHVCGHVYMHACMQTNKPVDQHTNKQTCMHVCKHTCIHEYMHTHQHTRKLTQLTHYAYKQHKREWQILQKPQKILNVLQHHAGTPLWGAISHVAWIDFPCVFGLMISRFSVISLLLLLQPPAGRACHMAKT